MSGRPETLDAYVLWLSETRGVDVTAATKEYYDAVALRMRNDFAESDVWLSICDEMRNWHDEYAAGGFPLFTAFAPVLVTKPYRSFLMKTFRKNCARNTNWPEAPSEGWITPSNWFEQINDIVRTFVVVKYLDGVEYVVKKLASHLDDMAVSQSWSLEARVEGYYAGHVVLKRTFEIPRENWDTVKVEGGVEIQVTTQLQEVMRTHLHEYYNDRRLREPPDLATWTWDYRSPEFATGYLGHILHYVEGMIVDIRDKQRRNPDD